VSAIDGPAERWWEHGVVYQVYVRSFGDTDGDGVGDLDGVTLHLDHLAWLGVDAVWLTPFYRSPMADFGYDVSDHTDVDPLFGDLAAFDRLLAAAHERGIRVIVDYVPNHTSDQHPWFVASRSSRDDPRRGWYIWRDRKPDGSAPNNWLSLFGGPAWEWEEATGQSYLHTFLREQPDLDWRNPAVQEAMFDVARFWLDRGVDGFRIDVASAVMKDPDLRDNPPSDRPGRGMFSAAWESQQHVHDFAHEDVYRVWRDFRLLMDGYDRRDGRHRMMIGEVGSHDLEKWRRYYGEALDGMHQPFGFHLHRHDWDAQTLGEIIERVESVLPDGAWPNWVLSNHDQPRIASWARRERARVAMMLLLTLRGAPTLYYGDELGMENVEIPPDRVQDPWEAQEPGQGRDPARTPMPWTSAPHGGFCRDDVEPWLPLGAAGRGIDVETQRADERSILWLSRRLLELRRRVRALARGSYATVEGTPGGDVYAYRRELDGERVTIALNIGGEERTVDVPPGGEVLISTLLDREEHLADIRVTLRPYEGVVVRHP
jgi:alpha-glucosidase